MGVPFRGKVDRTVSDTTFVVWYSGAWCVLEAEAMNLCAGDDLARSIHDASRWGSGGVVLVRGRECRWHDERRESAV